MIPPIKVVDAGVERTDVLELIWNNVRWPEGVRDRQLRADGGAQGGREPDRRDARQVRPRHGLDCVEEMLDRTETQRPRASSPASRTAPTTASPRPTTTAPSSTSRSGSGCEATVKGDELDPRLLEAATACARASSTASTRSTYSRAVAGSFLFFDPALAEFHNEGSMRPITVIAPEGTRRQRAVPGDGRRLAGERRHAGAGGDRATRCPRRCPTRPSPAGVAGAGTTSRASTRGPASATSRRRPTPTAAPARSGATTATRARWACPGSARSTAAASRRSRSASRGEPCKLALRCPTCRVPAAGAAAAGMLWEVENLGGDVGAATGSSDGDLTQPPGARGGERRSAVADVHPPRRRRGRPRGRTA